MDLKTGDRVILREDVLKRHARSVPAHMGYTHEQFKWRDILRKLEGRVGVIERTFPNSRHVNVEFPGGELIGIDNTELIRVSKNPRGRKRKVFHLPFRVDIWFERDRASVIVYDAEDNEVFEAWDEDVGQLVEDGFIKSRDIKGSALDYTAYLLGFKDHYDMRVKVNRQYEMFGEDLKIGNVTIVGDEKEEEEE